MIKYLKFYSFFILSFVAALAVKSQGPVITSAAIPNVGSVIQNEVLDTTGFVLSNPGANQTWDYHSLDTLGDYPFYYVAVSSVPNASSFANANLAVETEVAIEYFNVSSSGYSNCGAQPGYPVDFNHPEKLFNFPLSYGDSLRSYFEADVIASDSNPGYVRSGYVTSLADAYGTLILPNGITYNNTLRVRLIENYQDSLGQGAYYYYTDSLYYWLSPNIAGTLLTYFHFTTVTAESGFSDTADSYSLYAYQSGVTTGIKPPISQFSSIKVYPNPANQYLQIFSSASLEKYSLTDISGQTICQGNFGDKLSGTIPVASLPGGIYVLQCQNSSGQTNIQKIIINR
jgi:hypothetical protein